MTLTTRSFGGKRSISLAALTLAASLVLSGCGGHHSSTSVSATTLTATIDWPERSRDVTNVSSGAVAAIITVTSGDPNTGDPVDFPPILRPSGTASVMQAWTSPTQVARISTHIQIRFYSTLPTGSTNSVANDTVGSYYASLPSAGDAYVPITVGDTTTDLGTIAVTGTIASLSIPNTTVNFGNSTTLTASAFDATGKITIALTGGSVTYSAPVGSPASVDVGGTVIADSIGPTTVTGSVTGGIPAVGTVTSTATILSIVGSSQLTTQQDGLSIRDTYPGTGTAAANGQTVTLTYAGYYTPDALNNVDSGNYIAFDATHLNTPRTVTLGDGTLPAGLNEAVLGMLPGGTRIVVIPAAQTAGLGIPAAAPAGAPGIYIIQRKS